MTVLGRQKTIGGELTFSGKALQTARHVKVVCSPSVVNSGIVFRRTDVDGRPAYHIGDPGIFGEFKRRSSLGPPGKEIQTVEHFLAALWGLGITNITVDVDGKELPALDGSALEFMKVLRSRGIVEQSLEREAVKILEPMTVKDGGSSVSIFPSEKFSVSYQIDYKVRSIGRERLDIEPDGVFFEKEIAPARTFCIKSEVWFLLLLGLGRGASYNNTLVMDDKGPIGTSLRFSNEPLRHKILDLIGDMYLLGMPVIGRIEAVKSGHTLNRRMVEMIYQKYIVK